MAAPHEKVQKPFKVVQNFATTTRIKKKQQQQKQGGAQQQQQLSQAAVIQFALQL